MQDNQRFPDIVDRCLSMMQAGMSVEECVALYPEHAAELREQLSTVELLGKSQPQTPAPGDAVRARGRAQLLGTVAQLREAASATPTLGLVAPLRALFGGVRRLAPLPVALVLLMLSLGGLAAAAAVVQPDVPGLGDVPVLRAVFGDGSSSSSNDETTQTCADLGASDDPAVVACEAAVATVGTDCDVITTDAEFGVCEAALDTADDACDALADEIRNACENELDTIEDTLDALE